MCEQHRRRSLVLIRLRHVDAPHVAEQITPVQLLGDLVVLDHEPLVTGPALHLWTRTDLKPTDIDMAQLYDGFTFNCLSWIEALGFCGWGEAKDFLDGGTNIALDGVLPLNTHGGQLSAGRLHGYGFLHEGATQMWGQAGDRQIATPPEVGVIGAGGGNTCGCLLLVRE